MVECREIEPLRWPLVKKFYKANGHKGAPRGQDRVLALRQGSDILAVVRLSQQNQNCLLLRGLWVAQGQRSQGYGSALLQQVLKRFGQQPIWCYPYEHLVSFYNRNGFSCIPAEQAPTAIGEPWRRYQNQGHRYLLMAHLPEQNPSA